MMVRPTPEEPPVPDAKAPRVGRITVSLPDEVETRLDELARQRGKSVSRLVAEAVEAMLDGASPPPQPPPGGELAGQLQETRAYLAGLAAHVSLLRHSLVELGNWSPTKPPYGWQFPPPAPYAPPPWRALTHDAAVMQADEESV